MTVPIGTIFRCSWGYDQTNVDFYQVVKATAKSLWVKKIAQQHYRSGGCGMSEYVVALKDKFLDEEVMMRRYKTYDGKFCFSPESYSWAKEWDEEPAYKSWYY